jgi:hypothetical protein
MTEPNDTRYSFESTPTRRTLDQAAKMLYKLLLRLGVDPAHIERISEADRRALIAFTSACHLNIEWYDRSRRRHQRMYWGFAVFTALVVVGLPVAISLTSAASKAFTAQIGVIITGVLSAHRLLASSFEKRNLARHFWKAQADLKSILYSFEDKWRGHTVDAEPPPELPDGAFLLFAPAFLAALDENTQQAEKVKSEEQQLFFARSEGSFSSISEILGLAYKQGSGVVESMQQDQKIRTDLRGQVKELEAVVVTLGSQLADLEQQVRQLESSTSSVDQSHRQSLLSTIDSLRRRCLDKELELTAARSKLSRL